MGWNVLELNQLRKQRLELRDWINHLEGSAETIGDVEPLLSGYQRSVQEIERILQQNGMDIEGG